MGKLYNFHRLIQKYSCTFTVSYHNNGSYEGGIYKPGDTVTESVSGAVVPVSAKKAYQSGGSYTEKDKELYVLSQLPRALLGGRAIYRGEEYSIEEESDYSEYCDAFVYVMKRVDADDKL